MPTPFEAGKNAKELGIDTSRTFVVVEDSSPFTKGEQLRLINDDDTSCPDFRGVKTGKWYFCEWSRLAYAEEPEPYQPRAGDRVSLEGEVRCVSVTTGVFSVLFDGGLEDCVFEDGEIKHVKLLSRKPRKLTKG